MMEDSTLDLFCEHESDETAENFSAEIEEKAENLGVTVDYYLMEFI